MWWYLLQRRDAKDTGDDDDDTADVATVTATSSLEVMSSVFSCALSYSIELTHSLLIYVPCQCSRLTICSKIILTGENWRKCAPVEIMTHWCKPYLLACILCPWWDCTVHAFWIVHIEHVNVYSRHMPRESPRKIPREFAECCTLCSEITPTLSFFHISMNEMSTQTKIAVNIPKERQILTM